MFEKNLTPELVFAQRRTQLKIIRSRALFRSHPIQQLILKNPYMNNYRVM